MIDANMEDPRLWPRFVETDAIEDSPEGQIALAWAQAMLNPKEIPPCQTSACASTKPALVSEAADDTQPAEQSQTSCGSPTGTTTPMSQDDAQDTGQ